VSKVTCPFLISKAELSQAQPLHFPKIFIILGIQNFHMAKLHFRPYISNQTLLFPNRIDEDIAANDPVRIVNALVDSLELSGIKALYKEYGRSPYHPQMMLKVILYAYMNNVYSCRKIEKLLHRDIHYIWLAGYEKPDFITINRFRNRVKKEINQVFTQLVLLLAGKGYVSLDVEYIDGTKIESKANKYTFVWRKSVETNRAKLLSKINVLMEQIDETIAQDKAAENESVEFTAEAIAGLAGELKAALSAEPSGKTKEEKKARRMKEKQVKELEKHAEKLSQYDNHLETMGERNSYSKTDKDATFMRMKEDAMNNGQTKPGYNLQIATENQFITDFAFFPNPTDTLTLIPFLHSFKERYKRLPGIAVADSGYGSEENYRFMDENNIEAFVKYNYFHKEQRPRHRSNPFHPDSFYYNAEQDYYVCPMGQHMNRIGTRRNKTASGYITQSARYQAARCQGCPLRSSCFQAQGNRIIEVNHRLNEYKRKARERLTSQDGVKRRGQRCIEPEAVFGQTKYNMAYGRFRHVGKEKVSMDFTFFAMAFNIKKMCAKIAKEAYPGNDNLENTLKKRYPEKIIALNPVRREARQKWAA
jgi:transposase